MTCTPRRPDLINALTLKRTTSCPNEANKAKQAKKIRKYQKLKELLERRPGFMVKVVSIVIRCLGGEIKQLEEDIKDLFDEKERLKVVDKIQKNVLWKGYLM